MTGFCFTANNCAVCTLSFNVSFIFRHCLVLFSNPLQLISNFSLLAFSSKPTSNLSFWTAHYFTTYSSQLTLLFSFLSFHSSPNFNFSLFPTAHCSLHTPHSALLTYIIPHFSLLISHYSLCAANSNSSLFTANL